jgi:hypothetical protein
MIRRRALLLLCLLLLATSARAEPADAAIAEDDGLRLSPAAVPTTTYGSDEGFGTGGVGTLYFHKDGVLPYKAALTLNIFITTRLIQAHRIRFESLRLFDLPLRALAQVGYYSTITQNFCGYGNAVTCSDALAEHAARASGADIFSDTYSQVRRKHHQMRFIRPYGEALARYALRNKPHRLEVWGGWRGSLYIPGELRVEALWGDGELFVPGPYPRSQWAQHRPAGEPGLSSSAQLGLALDDRDEETQPNVGYFVEASLRASGWPIGSRWNWVGGNATAAVYVPLVDGPLSEGADLVLATRGIVDVMLGDVPTEDLARLGGLTDFIAFGGSDVGRGIREHRYLGKIKVMSQTELRWSFTEFEALSQHLKLGLAGFVDLAWLGYDVLDWRGEPFGVVGGVGSGFRLLWNRNFAVRLDVGFSPLERYEPRVYIRVGNPF